MLLVRYVIFLSARCAAAELLASLQIYSSASSPVYKIIYGGAGDGAVRAYKIPTGETLWTALGHTENVNCLVASEYLEFVISGSADGSVRAWDIRNGTPRWSKLVFSDKTGVVRCACAEWEKIIVFGGENGSLVALSTTDGKELWRSKTRLVSYESLQAVPTTNFTGVFERFNLGYMLLIEDSDGIIEVRNLKVRGLVGSLLVPPRGHVCVRARVCVYVCLLFSCVCLSATVPSTLLTKTLPCVALNAMLSVGM